MIATASKMLMAGAVIFALDFAMRQLYFHELQAILDETASVQQQYHNESLRYNELRSQLAQVQAQLSHDQELVSSLTHSVSMFKRSMAAVEDAAARVLSSEEVRVTSNNSQFNPCSLPSSFLARLAFRFPARFCVVFKPSKDNNTNASAVWSLTIGVLS